MRCRVRDLRIARGQQRGGYAPAAVCVKPRRLLVPIMLTVPQWKVFSNFPETGPPGVWIPPKPVIHHQVVPSCGSVNSDCSFFSADETLHALDLEGCSDAVGEPVRRKRSRFHGRSRSLESFPQGVYGSLEDWEMRSVPGDEIAGLEEQPSIESALCLPEDLESGRADQPGQCRPLVPPLPLHRLSKFKATISVEISQEKAQGYKPSTKQVVTTNTTVSKGISNRNFETGTQSQLFKASKHISTRSPGNHGHARFHGLQCFSVNPDMSPRVEGEDTSVEKRGQTENSLKGRGSKSFPARLGSILTSLRDRGANSNGSVIKASNRSWKGIKSWRKRRSKEGAGRIDQGNGAPWGGGDSNLEINVGVQVGKFQVTSLCPSIPGTNTKQFTSRGPNVSWVDEDFFDCDENWEVLLAPLGATDEPDSLSKVGENDGGASLAMPIKRPSRPHRLRGSVEDVVPIYTPLTSVAELDGNNKNQFGYISSRKVVLPGLSTIPRKDEVGVGVKTLEELKAQLNGSWERIPEESDDPSVLCDVMELPWIFKRALSLSSQTEVCVLDDRVAVKPKIFGLTIPNTATPWTREGVLMPRRDRRKGLSRISLVRTTFGFRQYNCWAEPIAGLSIVEVGMSDQGRLVMSSFIKRRTGASCKIRTTFKRI